MNAVVKLTQTKPGVVRVNSSVFRLPTSQKNTPPEKGSVAFSFDERRKAMTRQIVGADFGRRIEGIASTSTIGHDKLSLSSMGCKISLPIPLLWSHGPDDRIEFALEELRIGEVYSYTKSENEIRIRARFDDTDAGNHAFNILVQDDSRRCLSVTCRPIEMGGFVDGVKFYKKWTMLELSVCERGMNPDCTFRIVG